MNRCAWIRHGVLLSAMFGAVVGLRADVFRLKELGRIEGTFANPRETPRKTYRIETADGMTIDIEPKYVEHRSSGEREAIAEYNAFAPFKEDTVANHLAVAEWCRDHRLPDLAEKHLFRILEHDPDHAEARQRLGHYKFDGIWTTREEILTEKGYFKKDGRWKTQQQIDVDQILDSRKKANVAWGKRIDDMRASRQDWNDLLSIDDPAAAEALFRALQSEPDERLRVRLIRAMSNIGTSPALHEIARWSMRPGESDEVRRVCLEEIRKHPAALPAIVGFYASHLGPGNNPVTINEAAFALAEVDGKTAIPQLIDALVTMHQVKRKIKGGSPAFDQAGNTSLTWGEKEVVEEKTSLNTKVLSALVRMTGVNFQYNKDAWRAWLIESRRTPSFNARRGG